MSEPKLYRILQITFIAIATTSLVVASVLFANGTHARKMYFRAWGHLREHEYALAVEGLEEYVARRPGSSSCWFGLAAAHFHTGDYKGAATALRTCWAVAGRDDVSDDAPWLIYLSALAKDQLPAGMLPGVFAAYSPGEPPDEYRAACRSLLAGTYADAATSFEACLGRMPGTPGEADALWGLAIARFHCGSYEEALQAIERIRAGSDKPPSEAFNGVVAYIKAAVEGQASSEEMPSVLRYYAPREKE